MTYQAQSIAAETLPVEPTRPAEELPMLDLAEFFRIIRTRKKTIAGAAALTLAVAALALSHITPLYSASAFIVIDQRQNSVVDANAVIAGLLTDPTSIENQVQILRSRNLAARVVDKLNLLNDPLFNPPRADDSTATIPPWLKPRYWLRARDADTSGKTQSVNPTEAAVNVLLANLTIAAQGHSSAIKITYGSENAARTASVANAFAETYVEDQLEGKYDGTQRASQWLSERLEQLSRQTRESEQAVERYKIENQLTDSANGGSIVQQQLSALNLQQISAQADLAQQEAKHNQVMALTKSGHSADVSQVVSSSLIAQLRQQETELLQHEAEMTTRYGPLYPKVVDLQSQKKNLATKIDEEVRRVIATVANEVEIARARVRSLGRSLAEVTNRTQGENLARVKLSELTASATSNRALYEAFLNRFKEIEGRDSVQAADARVISSAVVPSAPSFPNKLVFLGAALPAGLLIGVLLAMLSNSLDTGFQTREQVEKLLGLPVLAAFPEVRKRNRKSKNPADRVIRKPRSSFAEAVRALQIGLMVGHDEKRPKIVVVTSSVPSEGKTTVAISLARIAARCGQRVILMDADFSQPSLIKTIKLPPQDMGIADVLCERATLHQALCIDPVSGAMLLPAVGRVSNPSDLLACGRMAELVQNLADSCDLLIIDSSPLLPVNDAKILAQMADAVVFVVRWRRTPRLATLQAVRSLADVRAPMAGVVLARTGKEQLPPYSYGRQNYRDFKRYYKD